MELTPVMATEKLCWCIHTIGLEDSENLVTCKLLVFSPSHLHLSSIFADGHTSDDLNLSDTVRISEDNTDLRWSCALLSKLADLVDDLLRGGLEPCWGSSRVGDGRG